MSGKYGLGSINKTGTCLRFPVKRIVRRGDPPPELEAGEGLCEMEDGRRLVIDKMAPFTGPPE